MNDWLIFGASPFINTIKDKIDYLLSKYPNIGINHPYFNYDYLAFLDNQVFNSGLKQKLIINYLLESTLKMDYSSGKPILKNNWVIKPEYISKNDYPISLLLAIEYAIYRKADRIILIGNELKPDIHYFGGHHFSKSEKELAEINNIISEFSKYAEILQTNKDSNLDLKFIDINSL